MTDDPRPRQRPLWLRSSVRAARLGAIAYLGLCLVLYALQTRLIFPGSATQGRADAVVSPREGEELVRLKTASGDEVVALFGPALNANGSPSPDAPSRPTVLYFYGNGMCLRNALFEVDAIRRLGANVVAADYVGYGMSGGSAGEKGCRETADAVYEHVMKRPDVDPSRVVAVGWSLGGAVAIDLGSRRKVAGLAVFSTFTSLKEMAGRAFPFLPISLLLAHEFDSLAKLPKVECPVLIGHGDRDQIVPHEMSVRLAAAAKGPVRRFTVKGADHNDFFDMGGPEAFPLLRALIEGVGRAR